MSPLTTATHMGPSYLLFNVGQLNICTSSEEYVVVCRVLGFEEWGTQAVNLQSLLKRRHLESLFWNLLNKEFEFESKL